MTDRRSDWEDTIVHSLALASKLEGEGQYNIAKLLRAACHSMTRRDAYHLDLPADATRLSAEIERAADSLSRAHVGAELIAALRRGGAAMAEGRLPLIHETPHPYVCRTCGHTILGEPTKCPSCRAWPTTFQRFLPVYWLDHLEPFEALEALRKTPSEVAGLLKGLSEDALARQPKAGGWSIRQVVSHLRDAQGVLSARLKLVLEEENPPLTSKAVFEWAAREEARPASTKEIFETYSASRQDIIATLEDISLKDWWRTGQHEEFGTVTLRQQASYFAGHEPTHLPQIESLRRDLVQG